MSLGQPQPEARVGAHVHRVAQHVSYADDVPVAAATCLDAPVVQLLDDQPQSKAVFDVEPEDQLDHRRFVFDGFEAAAFAVPIAERRPTEALALQGSGLHRFLDLRASSLRDSRHAQNMERALQRVGIIFVVASDLCADALKFQERPGDRLEIGSDVAGVRDHDEEIGPRFSDKLDHLLILGKRARSGCVQIAERFHWLMEEEIAVFAERLLKVHQGRLRTWQRRGCVFATVSDCLHRRLG